MHSVTGVEPWRVWLLDGTVLMIWASAYSVENGEYVFDNLVDASIEEQALLDIGARTPSNPERVSMVVARLPEASVLKVIMGEKHD